jgi:hypothetical protein
VYSADRRWKGGRLYCMCYYCLLSSDSRPSRNVCLHCNKNPICVFLFWKLRGLSPKFHIYVSVSDFFFIPRIGPHICLQQNRKTDPGNIYCKSLTDMNWETEHYNSVLEIIGFSPALHLQCGKMHRGGRGGIISK